MKPPVQRQRSRSRKQEVRRTSSARTWPTSLQPGWLQPVSPRVRYEATTVYGVLDLVSADLGVALVPGSTALLGIKGVALRSLRKPGAGEVLALRRAWHVFPRARRKFRRILRIAGRLEPIVCALFAPEALRQRWTSRVNSQPLRSARLASAWPPRWLPVAAEP
jgi:DNA-binding transcriptional LysR family regulator